MMEGVVQSCDGTTSSIELSRDFYPLLALQKTAYEFSARAKITLANGSEGKVRITFASLFGKPESLIAEFTTRANDISLQECINAQTRTVRDALVTAALWESLPR